MMENLGDLWDGEQYETEYNLDNFIESLKWLQCDRLIGHECRSFRDQSCDNDNTSENIVILMKSELRPFQKLIRDCPNSVNLSSVAELFLSYI